MDRPAKLFVFSALIVSALTSIAPAANEDALLSATFLGGSGTEGFQYSGAIDAAVAITGEVYVVGMTDSPDFPITPGAYICSGCGGGDIFIVKLSGDLSILLASAIIGGSQTEAMPSVAVSSDGTVFVAGHTNSIDFPVTAGAYDLLPDANNNIFVARLNADLSSRLAATYLGGNGDDLYTTIDLDPAGDVVVCGITSSGLTNTFPTTLGAYDRTCSPNYPDFFVSKLSSDLSQLMASTFLGGRYEEKSGGARVDQSGNIIVGGATESDDYPSTPGAYGESYHGLPQPGQYLHDVVISKLSNNLDSLLASTFIGTNGFDGGQLITLDNSGNVFIGGHTDGINYPVTPGALDEDHNGQNEYMLTKVDNDLTTILASTFLSPNDAGFTFLTNLATDSDGNVYGVGAAWSADCLTTPTAYDTTFNGGANDFNLIQLSGDLTTLGYATFLGGSVDEGDCAVAIDSAGNVFTAGYTSSADMPATPGSYDEIFNGGSKDMFAAKFYIADVSVPVYLANFYVQVGTQAVDLTWNVSEDAEADNFRLTAVSKIAQWDLPIIPVSTQQFKARDERPAEGAYTEVTYNLYTRESGDRWRLLGSETVEKPPGFGVTIFGVYPSPAAGEAAISFAIGSPQRLEIGVYDVTGRRLAVLADKVYSAGRHQESWTGRDNSGRKAASGVYFFRLGGSKSASIRKFVVLR